MKLSFPADAPPLAVIVAAKISGLYLSTDPSLPSGSPSTLLLPDGTEVRGLSVQLRSVARAGKVPSLSDRDAGESSQIDEWVEYASMFGSGPGFEGACTYADGYLLHRTYLIGNDLSVADIAVWSALTATGSRWESLRKSKKFQTLVRWYNSILGEYGLSEYIGKRKGSEPQVSTSKPANVNGAVTGGGTTKQTSEIDLPDAVMGRVKVRFAPEPSGYLHIGHSKAALLNKYFAERYQGEVVVRFDDTNPDKESNEFVDNLLKDINTLGIKYQTVTYTSNYFPEMMKKAEEMIRQGKAYVDDTPREQMQQERMDGTESKCRNNSVDENLKLWKEMIAGSARGLKCCVRGKLDMQNPNKTLRDPVYYRCNLTPHHKIGSKYKVYPTYDFACPYVDSIEGITHALRSSEYHDRNAQYHWIQNDMGFQKVQLYEFSRVNMVYTLLSKRKLLWFVQNGKVDGWDDPRFPTVQGIVRRGLKIEALIQFMLEQGASKNLNLMEWDKLWAINKKIIDPVCPRHTAVIDQKKVLLTLMNGPEEPFVRTMPKHKKFEGAGLKATTFMKSIWIEQDDAQLMSANEEVTLMDWGNAIINQIEKDQEGNVTKLTGVLHLEGSVKTTKLKLTWLPDSNELIPLSLVDFDYLITKKKLEEDEDFVDVVNPVTKMETPALGDSNMRNLKRGDVLQLERKGYFICDVPFLKPSKAVVLFSIPDGKQTSGMRFKRD